MFLSIKDLYEYKLNTLLEITQKINSEFDENELIQFFCDKLERLIEVQSLRLFIYTSNRWEQKVSFGAKLKFSRTENDFTQFNELTYLDKKEYPKWEYDVVLPIYFNNKKISYILIKYLLKPVEDTQLPFVRSLSNIVFSAIENKKFRERRRKQKDLEKELSIAADVQSLLVPRDLPKTPQIEMNSTYIPHKAIGGDYFDYIEMNEDEFLVCIADVSGKGVPAALLMSNFQATLRTLARHNFDLKTIVKELNATIFELTKGERFITAFFAIYSKKKNNIRYINAGHNPPFYLDRLKKIKEELNEGTVLLGVFEELPFLNMGQFKVIDYSMLFMYTDGLTEIFDEKGEEFGEVGLEYFLRTEETTSLSDLHEELLDIILSYSIDGFQDDITILSCKFRN